MREQIVFIADDGTVCETKDEAMARDEAIKQKDTIKEWMESAEITGKKIPEYHRVITDYLAYAART